MTEAYQPETGDICMQEVSTEQEGKHHGLPMLSTQSPKSLTIMTISPTLLW